jgi:hypothetical protein
MDEKRKKAIAEIMERYGMSETDASGFLDGCFTAALDIILQGPVYNAGHGHPQLATND